MLSRKRAYQSTNFVKFHVSSLSLIFFTLMGSFCPNHVKFQLKSTQKLSLMTLKSSAKLKEKAWKFHFDGLFLFKVYKDQNTNELSFMTLNSDTKFEETLTLTFHKWNEELGELSLEQSKVWKIVLCEHSLSKAYNMFQLENSRGLVSWH